MSITQRKQFNVLSLLMFKLILVNKNKLFYNKYLIVILKKYFTMYHRHKNKKMMDLKNSLLI